MTDPSPNTQSLPAAAAGRFTFAGSAISVNRMGYGAMRLAGPNAFGPPKDPDEALAILREALALGVDHIDTSDFYGPHVTNRLIREALYPYPEGLVLVTKIGASRNDKGDWLLIAAPISCVARSKTIWSALACRNCRWSTCAWAAPRMTCRSRCAPCARCATRG